MSTGTPGLDALLGGGLVPGTNSLIINGAASTVSYPELVVCAICSNA